MDVIKSIININREIMIRMKLRQILKSITIIGTTGNGFVIWDLHEDDKFDEEAVVLTLPYGTRNITTKMLQSNSVTLSAHKNYAIAGVR